MGDDVCWLDRSNDDSHARDLIGKIAKKSVEGLPGERKEATRRRRKTRHVPPVTCQGSIRTWIVTISSRRFSGQTNIRVTLQNKSSKKQIHVTTRTCLIFSASFSHYILINININIKKKKIKMPIYSFYMASNMVNFFSPSKLIN